jgi:predicted DNA binding protein
VLERGYLDPAPTHEQAAEELGLSRAAYFRRLREAVERVSAELGG